MIGQLTSLLEQLDALQARAIEQLETIETSAELEEWDTTYLGRKRGELTSISSVMGKLSKDERPLVGQKINAVKAALTERLAARRESLRQREMLHGLEQERIDVTLPGRALPAGHMHPISRTIWEVTQIFVNMGFHVIDGPEV
jgi:phenylalanyl-tRNA synthetase alpha chain